MPYHVGAEGSNGCSGFPVVSADGKVMGCHPTKENAVSQVQALYANEPGLHKEYEGCGCPTCEALNVTCEDCPVCNSEVEDSEEIMTEKNNCCNNSIEKQAPCWDGYVQRGMKPGADGKMVPNCVPAQKAEDYWEDDDTVVYDEHEIAKADGYVPPAGARAAARKAIKFKEQGKANGAGTSVGWTRAGQLARGETLSLSTVKRMYSYFSRHEVDKKGKDWANQSNPSNGYIMWLAWGGDAGFSWSRKIVNKETDKMLFANFGREVEKVEQVKHTVKRDYPTSSRETMAESGSAMPDGSFPIANATDLRNAIQSVGRAKDYNAAKQHIIRRARALGLVDMLPEDWKKGVRKTNWGGSIFDLNPFVK